MAKKVLEKNSVERIEDLLQQERLLEIEKDVLFNQAFQSNDPNILLKANTLFSNLKVQKQSPDLSLKSYFLDPYSINNNLEFREKHSNVTYQTLRNMSNAPIIKSIITTRVEQICNFSQYQEDPFSTKFGWSIYKKGNKDISTLSKQDHEIIEDIVSFIENCGDIDSLWSQESFESTLRKLSPDTLSMDQATFEIVRDSQGVPREYFVTDGATYRLTNLKTQTNSIVWKNALHYYPTYVQILNNQPFAEFYPWELCFITQNPQSNIHSNGYGRSILEDMIKIVTWQLYGDQYNGNFFSQGAAPKGIIRLQGNVNTDRLKEFKQQWKSQVAGVANSWKTPILEADKMDFINLQMSNQDMQFSNWQEYLIKMSCALFKIDPSEIGFPMGGSSNGAQFEADRKYKLEYSQEKGLYPILRLYEKKFHKYLVEQLNSGFGFKWTGINNEDEDKILDQDIKKLTNFMGYKEIRKKYGLIPELPKGDMIFNGIYSQMKQQEMQQQGQGGGLGINQEQNYDTNNPNNPFINREEENNTDLEEYDKLLSRYKGENEENPFMKSCQDHLNKLITLEK